jgi:hypothetical protein
VTMLAVVEGMHCNVTVLKVILSNQFWLAVYWTTGVLMGNTLLGKDFGKEG